VITVVPCAYTACNEIQILSIFNQGGTTLSKEMEMNEAITVPKAEETDLE
jgi:hypothetical protein